MLHLDCGHYIFIMDLQTQEIEKALFCPVASLYSLSTHATWDEHRKMISECFRFNNEVGPGWILYDPNKITIITSNDMFRPMEKPRDNVNLKKQLIKIRTYDDLSELEKNTLEKPVLLCVTRRQHFGTPVDVSPLDTEFSSRRNVTAFDIDFAVIFPPPILRQKLKDVCAHIRIYLAMKRKFCFMVSLKEMLKDLDPDEMRDSNSLEYVSWHNTNFWLTNHCKPHHSLKYVNNFLFWTALFPYAFFAALPYRAVRGVLCKDKHVALHTPMQFRTGDEHDRVVVCLWSNEAPPPGAYEQHFDQLTVTAAQKEWLRPFLRDSNMITFGFEKGEDYSVDSSKSHYSDAH